MEFFLLYAVYLLENNTILNKGVSVGTQARYVESAAQLVVGSNGTKFVPRYERLGGKK